MDTRAREPRSLVTWPTRVRRGVGVCDRRRASTASSGSSSVDGVFRFATRGSYAVSVYSAMADSVEYKLRYAVSSPLPGTMVRSWFKNDRLKREFIVPPSAGVGRGRVGGACNARTLNGRSLRAHVRGAVRPRSASRAGGKPVRHSGLWAVIATAPVKARSGPGRSHGFRVSVCSRLDGCGAPGAPGRCIFADAPRPRGELTRIGDHLPQKPRIAGPASLPGASPLVARGAPARTHRPLSRLGDWDTDSRDQARPAAADTLRRPTCTRHRLKRGKW